MIRRYVLIVAVALSVLPARSESAATLADSIEILAEHEPVGSAIDTRLRAAEILMPSDSVRSRKFLSQALDVLRAHPEVPRTYGMASSLLFLNPPDAERILLAGSDRLNDYKVILRYWRQWGITKRLAETLRKSMEDSSITSRAEFAELVRPVLSDLAEENPKEAAELFLEISTLSPASASETALPNSLGGMLTSFANVVPARVLGVRDALVLLLPALRDTRFASKTPSDGVVRFAAGGGVETGSARDTILFRFGVLLHAVAPDAYREASGLFGSWSSAFATINSPEEAARASRVAGGGRTPLDQDITAAAQLPSGRLKVNSYVGIISRNDLSPEQRSALVDGALKELPSISSSREALSASENLLGAVRRRPIDAALMRRVLSQHLTAVQNAGRNPDDYIVFAQAELDAGIAIDSEDPILVAKRAILQLQSLPDVQPLARFQSGHSLRPDERGPYRAREEHTVMFGESYSVVMCTEVRSCTTYPEAVEPRSANRALLLDLSRPVPGTGAVSRGVVRATEVNFGSFWGQDNTQTMVFNGVERPGMRRVRDIPVGRTVFSDRTELRFFIRGVQHILQFGPWTAGQYQATQGSYNGNGTTRATLSRKSATTWIVRSAPHSVGRLWDNHDFGHPVDLGLYYFSIDVQFEQMPTH